MKHRVQFEGRVLQVDDGTSLRQALFDAGLTPHNGNSRWFNCKGFGTCGTCAVQIVGAVSPPSVRERARLSFPPHTVESNLRLACQVAVKSDLTVIKHDGFWGQQVGIIRAHGDRD